MSNGNFLFTADYMNDELITLHQSITLIQVNTW